MRAPVAETGRKCRSIARAGSASRPRARAGLAALAETDFARLLPDQAELLRSYYGLGGYTPTTKKELAGRLGLTAW